MWNRRRLIIGLLIGCASTILVGCSAGARDMRPNIVVVMVDALRRDHLGVHGHDQPTSPYIDSLAVDGLIFDDAWSQGSQTIISTASFLTSTFFPPIASISRDDVSPAVRENLQGKGPRMTVLLSQVSSFPRVLSNSGYSTVAFLTNPHHNRHSGFPEIFDAHVLLLDGEAITTDSEKPYAEGGVVLEQYLKWLEEGQSSQSPYMAYVHLMDVHNPYRPPEEFRARFVTASGVDRYGNKIPLPEDMPSENDLQFMTQSYDAEIAYADSVIEKLHLAALAASSRPLVLVITSDHGDEFLDHGGLGHGRTLEAELLRVPLIVHGTGLPPRREQGLVRLVDVGPSLLELVGVPIPEGWTGRPVFRSNPEAFASSESVANYGRLMSVTTADWHVIWNRSKDRIVLYDRRRDPRGLVDVSGHSSATVEAFRGRFADLNLERRAVRDQVAKQMDSLLEELRGTEIDRVTEEQLRALGYAN